MLPARFNNRQKNKEEILSMTSSRFPYTTQQLCDMLKINAATLRRHRALQVLRPGIHFVNIGTGTTRPRQRWSLEAVQEAIIKRSKKTLS